MKIIIFSDSHGDVDTMQSVVEGEKPDAIVHLGDHITDADKLSRIYPDIQMFKVLGNTDSYTKDEECIKYVDICGKRFMLTHGHTFIEYKQSKPIFEGIMNMFLYGEYKDITLFGHTHEPFINCCNDRWIMNPGRIGRVSSQIIKATYGVLEIGESGVLKWRFVELS